MYFQVPIILHKIPPQSILLINKVSTSFYGFNKNIISLPTIIEAQTFIRYTSQ